MHSKQEPEVFLLRPAERAGGSPALPLRTAGRQHTNEPACAPARIQRTAEETTAEREANTILEDRKPRGQSDLGGEKQEERRPPGREGWGGGEEQTGPHCRICRGRRRGDKVGWRPGVG